jgi:hypothetical protein
MDTTKETVFEFGGEGGSICIYRQKTDKGDIFIYHHSEIDPIDEEIVINKTLQFDSFEQPFNIINERYSWYTLFVTLVHMDFRDYVRTHLIYQLNNNKIIPRYIRSEKRYLEESLDISLIYNDDNKWSAVDGLELSNQLR